LSYKLTSQHSLVCMQGWLLSPLLPININKMHRTKHGSDSEVRISWREFEAGCNKQSVNLKFWEPFVCTGGEGIHFSWKLYMYSKLPFLLRLNHGQAPREAPREFSCKRRLCMRQGLGFFVFTITPVQICIQDPNHFQVKLCSQVYDTEGRFVPEKFEEIFSKYDRDNKGELLCVAVTSRMLSMPWTLL
jgi:hypothetical protein